MRGALPAAAVAVLTAAQASAWPGPLMDALARDARRLIPRSLGELLLDREREVGEAVRRAPPELTQTLALDLSAGRLRPETVAAFDGEIQSVLDLLKQQRLSEGVVRLGALLRLPADVADPVLAAGPEGYPPGVTREYYAFIGASLDKLPVVLDDPAALKIERRALGAYWQSTLDRSRRQSAVIREEMFRNGRVVLHTTLDYRSPVFGVGSLAYSRAVTGIAATWLAVWREAHGDPTRIGAPRVVTPGLPTARPSPEAP
jgi:hypothetical protein